MSPHGEYASDQNIIFEPVPAPVLSFITYFDHEDAALIETGRHVASLARMIGEPVEWVIACDGPVRTIWVASTLQRIDESLLVIHVLGSETALRLGVETSRGRALDAAKGKYVGVLFADGLCDSHGLTDMYQRLSTSTLGWAAGAVTGVDMAGKTVRDTRKPDLPSGAVVSISAFLRSTADPTNENIFLLIAIDRIRNALGWDETLTDVQPENSALWCRIRARTPGVWTNLNVLGARVDEDVTA
jgi:hypothetical protein